MLGLEGVGDVKADVNTVTNTMSEPQVTVTAAAQNESLRTPTATGLDGTRRNKGMCDVRESRRARHKAAKEHEDKREDKHEDKHERVEELGERNLQWRKLLESEVRNELEYVVTMDEERRGDDEPTGKPKRKNMSTMFKNLEERVDALEEQVGVPAKPRPEEEKVALARLGVDYTELQDSAEQQERVEQQRRAEKGQTELDKATSMGIVLPVHLEPSHSVKRARLREIGDHGGHLVCLQTAIDKQSLGTGGRANDVAAKYSRKGPLMPADALGQALEAPDLVKETSVMPPVAAGMTAELVGELLGPEQSRTSARRLLFNRFCTTPPREKPLGHNMVPTTVEVSSLNAYFSIDAETAEVLCRDEEASGATEANLRLESRRMFQPQRQLQVNTRRKRFQSLVADLPMSSKNDSETPQSAVVDSGAAWSSIRESTLRHNFPAAYDEMETVSDMTFVDASNRTMTVKGSVRLRICVASHCFWTTVFVFETLGAEFLLGVNTLVDGDIIIHAADSSMYSAAREHRDSPRVRVRAEVRPQELRMVQATCDDGCDECGGLCGSARQMHVEVRAGTETSGVIDFWAGGDHLHSMECAYQLSEQPLPELDVSKGGDEPLYAAGRCTIPGKAAGSDMPTVRAVRVVLDKWSEGAVFDYDIIPAKPLLNCGVDSPYSTRHSSMNCIAGIPVLNHGLENVVVAKGTLVGYARKVIKETRSSSLLVAQLESYEELQKRPFSEGGPPITDEDFKELGLDFEQCIDGGRPLGGGRYERLGAKWIKKLKASATTWWMAWSRNTRAPRISGLTVVDIPTGTATPVAQKPYGIAHRYIAAFKEELQKLLDEGLIEPGISNWASPVLLTVKKDSVAGTGGLKVKIVVDYRKLNAVTINDSGSLGTQDEILNSFGSGQKYVGIADIAGGFYQFCIDPADRHKTAFVLPTSMGGTTFVWRVCPYGLCRMPAAYSRAMMFALQGLQDVALAPLGESMGSVHSWLDDVIFHADTLEGFCDLFDRVLQRLCAAGLSLKASKTDLLRAACSILGYHVTPDGMRMDPKKTSDISRIPTPTTPEEVLVYLGSVNFYRRFVPRLAMLAKPLTDMLRTNGTYNQRGVASAVEAINEYLVGGEMMAFPDFRDRLAEFVLCTDACDVAVGATLLQWQHALTPKGTKPPEGVPVRGGEKQVDPLTNSWRLAAGWVLKTIAYYAKTLDATQARYTVFDKEAGAIVLAVRQFTDVVTGYPTTVYTDSSVAATMLTKYKGTARLARWGMELMSYLPHLRLGYRAGKSNGMADLLSRFPYFAKYVPKREHVASLPDDLYEQVAEAQLPRLQRQVGVSLMVSTGGVVTLQLAATAADRYLLYDPRVPRELESVWQGNGEEDVEVTAEGDVAVAVGNEDAEADRTGPSQGAVMQLGVLETKMQESAFHREQREFEKVQGHWEWYAEVFIATHGRLPVLYDFYCGEGGYSRGARITGARCFGFDKEVKFAKKYESEPVRLPGGHSSTVTSGMTFYQCDLSDETLWAELLRTGSIKGLPPPDIIHASPPCQCFTKLNNLSPGQSDRLSGQRQVLDYLIDRLGEYGRRWGVPWEIESVPESLPHVTRPVRSSTLLCGTMMGHRVFRHRVIYTSYPLTCTLHHSHEDKRVGSRGMRRNPVSSDEEPPNMYGVYSRRYEGRGSYDEWHAALGHVADTFTRQGIVGALPSGFGRYLCGQLVAWRMAEQSGMPVFLPDEITHHQFEMLQNWARDGYRNPVGVAVVERLKVEASLEDGAAAAERIAALLCEHGGHVTGDGDTIADGAEWKVNELVGMPFLADVDPSLLPAKVISKRDVDGTWRPWALDTQSVALKAAGRTERALYSLQQLNGPRVTELSVTSGSHLGQYGGRIWPSLPAETPETRKKAGAWCREGHSSMMVMQVKGRSDPCCVGGSNGPAPCLDRVTNARGLGVAPNVRFGPTGAAFATRRVPPASLAALRLQDLAASELFAHGGTSEPELGWHGAAAPELMMADAALEGVASNGETGDEIAPNTPVAVDVNTDAECLTDEGARCNPRRGVRRCGRLNEDGLDANRSLGQETGTEVVNAESRTWEDRLEERRERRKAALHCVTVAEPPPVPELQSQRQLEAYEGRLLLQLPCTEPGEARPSVGGLRDCRARILVCCDRGEEVDVVVHRDQVTCYRVGASGLLALRASDESQPPDEEEIGEAEAEPDVDEAESEPDEEEADRDEADSLEGVAEPRPHATQDHEPGDDGEAGSHSPYAITVEQQDADPEIMKIKERISKGDESTRRRMEDWVLEGQLLRKREIGGIGDERRRLYVPAGQRNELMHHSHHTMNSGHMSRNLFYDLSRDYYWPNMQAECNKFVLRCRRCQQLQPVARTRVFPGEVPEPSTPFHTLHIDYKVGLPVSGGYKHVLVVVCALTRYCLYIPATKIDAAETFRLLLAHVFCHFGIPVKIVADNGGEFHSELSHELGRYMGYRNIHVLPYTPQANGLAESAVKRLKRLLERHTLRFHEWHKILPMIQYTLNTAHHTGTKVRPFEAVFGRDPIKLPQLENPDTLRPAPEGSVFLRSLRDRMQAVAAAVKWESENTKAARWIRAQEKTPGTSVFIEVGDEVWIQTGGPEAARRLRKSGRGSPWRHRYRVVAVNDFSVKVEPLDGSPRIMEWQALHRVSKSPSDFNDLDYPARSDVRGRALLPATPEESADAPVEALGPESLLERPSEERPPAIDGNDYYSVDRVLSARREGRRWYYIVKWTGWASPTEEPQARFFSTCTAEVRAEAEEAKARALLEEGGVSYDDADTVRENDETAFQGDDHHGEIVDPRQSERAAAETFVVQTLTLESQQPRQPQNLEGTPAWPGMRIPRGWRREAKAVPGMPNVFEMSLTKAAEPSLEPCGSRSAAWGEPAPRAVLGVLRALY